MNIPATGANPAKEKFFKEVADAFKFLAIFYSLNKEQQAELMQTITAFQAKGLKK